MTHPPASTDAGTEPGLDLAVAVEDESWTGAVPDLEPRVRAAVLAAIAGARADGGGRAALCTAPAFEMGLVFTDDARVHALNWQYRHKDAPTNVLAFESTDLPPAGAPWQLGDVVVAFGTACAEAAAARRALSDHAVHLVVHGVLHLFGYDHQNDRDAHRMERLEVRVLAGLGIADPYAGGDGAPAPAKDR